MSIVFKDRVKETTGTVGTGALVLAGGQTGYQPFSIIGDGAQCYYCVEAIDGSGQPTGDWEVGIGTYSLSGNSLARTAVLDSSNSGSLVSLAAGTKNVFLVSPAAAMTALAPLASPHFTGGLTVSSNTPVPLINALSASNLLGLGGTITLTAGATVSKAGSTFTVSAAGDLAAASLTTGGRTELLSLDFGNFIDDSGMGASTTIDFSLGNNHAILLTEDVALSFVNPHGLATVTLELQDDGSGGHTVTWPTITWLNTLNQPTTPPSSLAGGKKMIVTLHWNGGNYRATSTVAFTDA